MYSIHNSDTLEILINTVHKMRNKTTWKKNYLWVNSIIGISVTCEKMELNIMQ